MDHDLEPSAALAARNRVRHAGESEAYRAARQKLLEREYDLRRLTEAVAAERRALPPGPPVSDYRFTGEAGEVTLAELFGDRDTLIVYSYMFGPERTAPCPMCSSLMAATAPRVRAIAANAAIAFVARSDIDRLVAAKRALGMPDLPVYSDGSGDYTRAFVSAEDADMPGLTVFRRDGGEVRLFWAGEMAESDPGQDPRSAPEVDPLWTYLDMTPEGRKADWYPTLDQLAQ